jgi:hypothetical protein
MPSAVQHPQLAAVIADIEAATARLRRLSAATPEAKWSARNDPARWSIAECVAHLNLTARAYVPLITAALAEARTLNKPAPARYRRDPMGWLLGIMIGPMPKVGRVRMGRVRTSAAFIPEGALPREQVTAEFESYQAQQIGFTVEADRLPVDEVRLTSAFDARVRYNLFSCLVMLPRHQHRHLQQAEAVWTRSGIVG